MKHAVVFDIDGTLLDSSADDEALYEQAITDVLGAVRFRDDLSGYEHVTDEGILRELLAENSLSPNPAVLEAVRQNFFQRLEAFVERNGPFVEIPGARAVIERLRRSDHYAVAIATGGWRRSAEIKLGTAGFVIDDMPLATSDDALSRADIMQYALDSLATISGRTAGSWDTITYYGDGGWDQQACRQLGWTFRAVGPALRGLRHFNEEFQD